MNASKASARALILELIDVARDGELFYLEAATRVRSPLLRDVFHEMAEVRRDLIDDLTHQLGLRGKAASGGGTLLGNLRQIYADVIATLSNDHDATYVGALEAAEDRMLGHYRQALREPPSPVLRAILERHLVSVLSAHNKMRTLKAIKRAA